MGRKEQKAIEEMDATLLQYGDLKQEESRIKKELKPLGEFIKDYLKTAGVNSWAINDYTAKITERKNEDFNEDRAIEILKEKLSKDDLKKVVRTKEYIDDDALESLVYNGVFDVADLECCKIEKAPTITLRVTKNK